MALQELAAAAALKKMEEYFDWCAKQRLPSAPPRRSTEQPPAAKRRKAAARPAESSRAAPPCPPSSSSSDADSQELLTFSTKEFFKSEDLKEFQKLAKDRYVMDMMKVVDASPGAEVAHAVNGFAKMLTTLMTLQPPVKKAAVTEVVKKVSAIFSEVGR